jgi:hypothetical protein
MAYAIHSHRSQVFTASGLDVLAAIWLIVSPFLLMFNSATIAGNNVILGLIIGGFALARFLSPTRSTVAFSWINALLGVWVLVSPWALQFSHNRAAMTNNVIMGIIVIILACWSAIASGSEHEMQSGNLDLLR